MEMCLIWLQATSASAIDELLECCGGGGTGALLCYVCSKTEIHSSGGRLDLCHWQRGERKCSLCISSLQRVQTAKEIGGKKQQKRERGKERGHSDIFGLRRQHTATRTYSASPPSPPVLCCPLFFSLQPVQIRSHLFPVTQPPPKPRFLSHLLPFPPCFQAVVTHPGGTIAGDFIPMHLPETCALRYGILSVSHKQVDQPKCTSQDGNKGTRFSLRLDPQL